MARDTTTDGSRRRGISRRGLMRSAAGISAAAAGTMGMTALAADDGKPEKAVTKGRIKQSIPYWCFNSHWSLEETCKIASRLGVKSVELVSPENWPTLEKYGLVCGMCGSHGIGTGMNRPENHEKCIAKIRESIDACAEYGFPNVITFTGNRDGLPDEEGLKNCVAGYKKVIGYAEEKGVNLCLEILNSRVDHAGYQGDHADYCVEIAKKVGSPRMKVLFDIYHVQIMDGDLIRRIRKHKDYIGHYHTAGNPGRHELNDEQEINYKPIMKEIADTDFDGYVGQEFVPTGDPLKGLRQAVELCDV